MSVEGFIKTTRRVKINSRKAKKNSICMKTLLAIMVFVGLLCYPGARDTQGDSEI